MQTPARDFEALLGLLAEPARRALAGAGVANTGELAAFGRERLAGLRGIGPDAMEAIEPFIESARRPKASRAVLEHAAVWCRDLERMARFFEAYFGGRAGKVYENAAKRFRSRFIDFGSGARLELMQSPGLAAKPEDGSTPAFGYAHLAFSVGSEDAVDALSARLSGDGFSIVSGPRRTGDGYYESVALDPEGNRVEVTA